MLSPHLNKHGNLTNTQHGLRLPSSFVEVEEWSSMLDIALATAAAVIAVAFGLSTLDRWLISRKPHELAWTVAFGLFATAAAFMAAGAAGGWSEAKFRGFYLFGAIVNVPVLALGTIMLHSAGKSMRVTTQGVAFFCIFATGVMVATPFVGSISPDVLPQGSEVFNAWPRLLAAVGSGVGAMVIFLGALRSAIKSRQFRYITSNSLIAIGTLILGANGLLNSVVGEMTAFSVTLTIGITVLFVGFLVATSTPKKIAIAVDLTAQPEKISIEKLPVGTIK